MKPIAKYKPENHFTHCHFVEPPFNNIIDPCFHPRHSPISIRSQIGWISPWNHCFLACFSPIPANSPNLIKLGIALPPLLFCAIPLLGRGTSSMSSKCNINVPRGNCKALLLLIFSWDSFGLKFWQARYTTQGISLHLMSRMPPNSISAMERYWSSFRESTKAQTD